MGLRQLLDGGLAKSYGTGFCYAGSTLAFSYRESRPSEAPPASAWFAAATTI